MNIDSLKDYVYKCRLTDDVKLSLDKITNLDIHETGKKNVYTVRLTNDQKKAFKKLFKIKLTELENTIVVGDKVKLLVSLKDGYGDVWHEKGDIIRVEKITDDKEGVMFGSQLGTHFRNVEKV